MSWCVAASTSHERFVHLSHAPALEQGRGERDSVYVPILEALEAQFVDVSRENR